MIKYLIVTKQLRRTSLELSALKNLRRHYQRTRKHDNLVCLRWSGLKPFHASNDDSDEDSNETDSNDTLSDKDSNDDSLSEMSAFSDNIVSSDSEDGAGHHFFRKASDYGENDANSDFSEGSSIIEDREDDARSLCYADSGSEDKEDDVRERHFHK